MSEAVEERLDLIDAAIYGDLFGCAVTFDELVHYARRPVDAAGLRRRLRDDAALRAVLEEVSGLYCLPGRGALAAARHDQRRRAGRLLRRARAAARLLQHAPFVRGIYLTGSVAADGADAAADVDLLVVVARGRLGTAFAVLGSLARLTGHRLFCPNFYVAEDALPMTRRDAYVAREVTQARRLAGRPDLRAANPWARDTLPNAPERNAPAAPWPGGRTLQAALERILGGRLGGPLERAGQRLALARLDAHHAGFGKATPAAVRDDARAGRRLRFHGQPRLARIVALYVERRAAMGARLAEALASGEAPPAAAE